MFVRKFRRKNRRGIGVQIVRSFRDARGRPPPELMVSVGPAPEGPTLDALVEVAEKKMAELGLARWPTLFPTDRLPRQALEALQDRRTRRARLPEVSQLAGGGPPDPEGHEVFGALWAEAGLGGVWEAGHPGVRQGCSATRVVAAGGAGPEQAATRRTRNGTTGSSAGQAPSLLSPSAACDGAQQTQESRQDPSQVSQVSQVSS